MNRTALKRNQTPIPRKRERPRRKANPYGESPVKKEVVAVKVFPDGREVCNLLCKAGADEYERRKRVMWERQGKKCCLYGRYSNCLGNRPGRNGQIPFISGTFEHEGGRGMDGGKRDDRIEINGKPINGVACIWCNTQKGSRRINYNEAP